jgi:hypothetical protein
MKPFSVLLLAFTFSTIPSSASPQRGQTNGDAANGYRDRRDATSGTLKDRIADHLPGAVVGTMLGATGVGSWVKWRNGRRKVAVAPQAGTSSEDLMGAKQRREASAMLKHKEELAQRGLRRSFKAVRRPPADGGKLVNEADLLPESLASDAEMMDCLLFYNRLADKVRQLWWRGGGVSLFAFVFCLFFGFIRSLSY